MDIYIFNFYLITIFFVHECWLGLETPYFVLFLKTKATCLVKFSKKKSQQIIQLLEFILVIRLFNKFLLSVEQRFCQTERVLLRIFI